MSYVFMPDAGSPPSPNDVGGKALGLYHLQQAGFEVPPWFVLTSATWSTAQQQRTASPCETDPGSENLSLPPEVRLEIEEASRLLGLSDGLLAVRSSARVEDASEQSFAGQFATVLHVRPENLEEAIGRVWASARSKHCREYARLHGIASADLIPAVVIQRMIIPEIAGVMFTADPVSGSKDTVVIAALYGLGEGIVDGSCSADTYYVNRAGVVQRQDIPHKSHCVRYDAERCEARHVAVPEELRDTPVCPDDLIKQITELGLKTADALGAPQDIEWCLADGHIYLVQARPITTRPGHEEVREDEPSRIWDNANLVENYPGMTLPLTFSFIDAMYSGVYRRMCHEFGLRESSLERGAADFRMLGYCRGRVYYNLLNWYRILMRLPGGARHCRHFDEMLGTSGGFALTGHPPGVLRSARVAVRLFVRFLLLPRDIRRFMAHVTRVREQADTIDIDTLSLSGLADHYETFERLLLEHWIPPQFNDFYCQTSTGLLKSAISRWLGDDYTVRMHTLLSVEESVESERAVISLRDLTASVRERPDLVEACNVLSPTNLLHRMQSDPEIGPRLDRHVKRYGDRWHGELKLETVTPRENPEVLMELLSNHVSAPPDILVKTGDSSLHRAIGELPVAKRYAIGLLTWISRRLIANRENTRFERTRVFGMVRRVFRTIGRKLAARGHLAAADDVFYLTKNEIFAFIEGTGVDPNPAATIRARRKAFAEWRLQSMPGRFQSKGLLAEVQPPGETGRVPATGHTLSGIGASPGIVRARIKVIRSPDELRNIRGCIIAAESTDPGWSFIFPLIGGILVERGSMLSHAAIVAREMNIPAIVAIDGLLARLQDNILVEIDGTSGTVTVLENEADDSSENR